MRSRLKHLVTVKINLEYSQPGEGIDLWNPLHSFATESIQIGIAAFPEGEMLQAGKIYMLGPIL
jgi:hypothetical protein